MARVPINPGKVDWSGENPGIYVKQEESGPFTTLITFFRVVYSPHGPGNAVYVIGDLRAQGRPEDQVAICHTDNRALAEYLRTDFIRFFGTFRDNPQLGSLPIKEGATFRREGNPRKGGSWTEIITGPGTEIRLTWADLDDPFIVEFPVEMSATGKHEMLSLFIPGWSYKATVNGVDVVGKVFPRDMAGKRSSFGFLAFAETWIRV